MRFHLPRPKQLDPALQRLATRTTERAKVIKSGLQALAARIHEIDHMHFNATLTGQAAHLRMQLGLTSKHRPLLKQLHKQNLELATNASSPFLARLRLRLPSRLHTTWTKQVLALSSTPKTEVAATKQESQAMARFWRSTTGELNLALTRRAQPRGPGIVGVVGLRDRTEAARSLNALFALGRQHTAAQYEQDAYSIGDVQVTRVTPPKHTDESAPVTAWQAFTGYDVALTADRLLIAYGPGRDAALTQILTKRSAAAETEMFSHTSDANQVCSKPFVIFEGNIPEALHALRGQADKASGERPKTAGAVRPHLRFCASATPDSLEVALSLPPSHLVTLLAGLSESP